MEEYKERIKWLNTMKAKKSECLKELKEINETIWIAEMKLFLLCIKNNNIILDDNEKNNIKKIAKRVEKKLNKKQQKA